MRTHRDFDGLLEVISLRAIFPDKTGLFHASNLAECKGGQAAVSDPILCCCFKSSILSHLHLEELRWQETSHTYSVL